MFGGLAFMIAGTMACGVINDDLMARVGPDGYEAALARPHTRPMNFTGLIILAASDLSFEIGRAIGEVIGTEALERKRGLRRIT